MKSRFQQDNTKGMISCDPLCGAQLWIQPFDREWAQAKKHPSKIMIVTNLSQQPEKLIIKPEGDPSNDENHFDYNKIWAHTDSTEGVDVNHKWKVTWDFF